MIIATEKYCKCCGKVFYTDYYTGGYIDHVVNFSRHHKAIGKDEDESVKAICFDGNNLREVDDIKTRLDCFMQWENVSSELKSKVQNKCLFLINKIKKAKEDAEKLVQGKNMLERKYIIKFAEYVYGTPFGTEDRELWSGYVSDKSMK